MRIAPENRKCGPPAAHASCKPVLKSAILPVHSPDLNRESILRVLDAPGQSRSKAVASHAYYY
ncbi:hypothetical protein IE4771_CH00342 [Rhizobium etli bv. mimosae str. IE4771]|uniref:Uncharacterized protein n=1 Tax=Rhizobium etli bv. mimosae str. IE4771 TaxID=1432050 RepID=A0A060HVH6_RHIET|nr:hypothetical protein IE4771_CH00342 [Rhizobium sp. IE4771]